MPRQSVEFNKSRAAYYAYYGMAPEIPWEALSQQWQIRWLNVVRTIDSYNRRVDSGQEVSLRLGPRAVRKDKGKPRPHTRGPNGPYGKSARKARRAPGD